MAHQASRIPCRNLDAVLGQVVVQLAVARFGKTNKYHVGRSALAHQLDFVDGLQAFMQRDS